MPLPVPKNDDDHLLNDQGPRGLRSSQLQERLASTKRSAEIVGQADPRPRGKTTT